MSRENSFMQLAPQSKSTKLLDEIETLIAKLNQQSIEFVVWDQEELSKQLKKHPELVDDFFGRPWVKKFCGETAAERSQHTTRR